MLERGEISQEHLVLLNYEAISYRYGWTIQEIMDTDSELLSYYMAIVSGSSGTAPKELRK